MKKTVSTASQQGPNKLCAGFKANGAACRSYALSGSDFCWSHDPANATDRAAARSAGGKARHGRKLGEVGPPPEPVTLATVADAIKVLEREVNSVLCLEVSLSRGQTVSRLIMAFVKCFEVSEIALRLQGLESALRQRKDLP